MSVRAAFTHVDVWVFDLDNTLYPPETDLFAQIDARMTDYVSGLLQIAPEEARAVQKQLYADHGTTLSGLMREHKVDPHAFMAHVHDIDLAPLARDEDLARLIGELPGKRFVFTNGSRRHAERVTEKLGVQHLFDDLFDIEAAGFTPKPHKASFDALITRHAFAPTRAAMFEDLARNLAPAADLGMRTVLVRSTKDWSHEPAHARPAGPDEHPAHVHHVADCLKAFLGAVVSD
jgi:putative hydrolase of the HAD superfamily